ncbi:MAG: AAA family ATPase, partial [Candidatus Kryptonium sp.]
MRKFTIGIQSFEVIRTDEYYYVDKTYFVAKLVNEGKYYFL